MEKYFVALIFAAAVFSTAQAQKNAKEAVKSAEETFASFMDAEISDIEQYCTVRGDSKAGVYISAIDGNRKLRFDGQGKSTFIKAGTHTLTLHLHGVHVKNEATGVISPAVLKTFTFEAGKAYYVYPRYFDSKTSEEKKRLAIGDEIVYELKEDPENTEAFQKKLATLKMYKNYSEANPNRFEGVYSGANKYMLNTFIASYTFEGNTMRYEGINKMIGKPLIVEGYFFYNENTIVLFSQKEFINGEEVEMFSNNHYFVWYYTLNGNELKI